MFITKSQTLKNKVVLVRFLDLFAVLRCLFSNYKQILASAGKVFCISVL